MAAIPALIGSSPLKREVVEGVDVLIVQRLTDLLGEKEGEERASDLSVYTREEIERVLRWLSRLRAPQAAGDERG